MRGILKQSSSQDKPRGILKSNTTKQTEALQTKTISQKDSSSDSSNVKTSDDTTAASSVQQGRIRSIQNELSTEHIARGLSRSRTVSEPSSAVAHDDEVVAVETGVAMSSRPQRYVDSSTEDSESGERYSKIKNEAVLRRKIQRDLRKQNER